MAWIKIDHTLPTKPEVFFISKALVITRTEVVGHLVSLWTWVDQNSENGKFNATREMIDCITCQGFANALIDQGWLHFTKDGTQAEIVNFDKHNGNSAKKRAQTAQRVANMRTRNAKSVTREEKKREDKKGKETWL